MVVFWRISILFLTACLLVACAGTRDGAPAAAAPAIAVGQLAADLAPLPARRGLVLAPERQAAEAGARLLAGGGNAADAAAATGLTLGITRPDAAGLGGGGLCLYRAPSGDTWSVTFLPRRSRVGHVAVPGTLRGLGALQTRFGQRAWAEVVVPAELVARRAARVAGRTEGALADPRLALMATIRGRGPQALNSGAGAVALAEAAAARRKSLDVQELAAFPVAVAPAAALGLPGTSLRLPPPGDAGSGRLGRAVALALAEGGATAVPPSDLDLPLPAEARVAAGDGALPSAGFVVLDPFGGLAACALTMVAPVTDDLRLNELGVTLARAPGPAVADPLEARWARLNEARQAEYFEGERGALAAAHEETSAFEATPEAGGPWLTTAFLLPLISYDGSSLRAGVAAGLPDQVTGAVAGMIAEDAANATFFAGPHLVCGGGAGPGRCLAGGTAYVAAPAREAR